MPRATTPLNDTQLRTAKTFEREYVLSDTNGLGLRIRPDIKNFINLHDACEDYPIHISIKRGRTDLTQWLLEAGANSRAKNYWENTASDITERNDDKNALSLLQGYST